MFQVPKFNLIRFGGTFTLQMNRAMAEDLCKLLDEFTDLLPHEFTLRRKLQSALIPAQQPVEAIAQ